MSTRLSVFITAPLRANQCTSLGTVRERGEHRADPSLVTPTLAQRFAFRNCECLVGINRSARIVREAHTWSAILNHVEAERVNEQLRRLESAVTIACAIDTAIGALIKGFGKVTRIRFAAFAASSAYQVGKAAGNFATGQKSPCTKVAQ